jgi:hypothetical protein
MKVTSETVIADLQPLAPPAKSATRAANTEPDSDLHFQIKLVTCNGHVVLTRHGDQLMADHMVYNPLTHIVTARGEGRRPAVLTRSTPDGSPGQPSTADELQYNTVDGMLHVVKAAGSFRH